VARGSERFSAASFRKISTLARQPGIKELLRGSKGRLKSSGGPPCRRSTPGFCSRSRSKFKYPFLATLPMAADAFFIFDGGSFDGPKLKGKVLPGGGGLSLIRRDDVMEVDVRVTLETDDKHQIYTAWKGLRHGPKEVMDRLYRGEVVDSRAYYFRTTPYFETSSKKYDWMNRICSIASGSLSPNARTLDVFQVL